MDLTKYSGKGATGLVNLGNTCFLNSCVQVLNHTYELHEFLNSTGYKRHMKPGLIDCTVIEEWNDLRNIMWSQNGLVSPNKFVYNIKRVAGKKGRDMFTGWAQNDLHEFLLFLIECMHNSISRKMHMNISGKSENHVDDLALKCYGMLKDVYSKEYSEIMDMFYGIYVSQIISMDNKVYSTKPESFFIIELPIPSNKPCTLYDCFDHFVISEPLAGENAWYNENTKTYEDVMKIMTFWNFPKILVITLKRFSPDGLSKTNNLIDFPIDNLDLSKYVKGYNPSQYIYDLFGICNHIGGVSGGHYNAFVKNSTGNWVVYNDEDVHNLPLPIQSHIITPMAYCLFYRKKNNLL
jgi:ubiquitin carboxyl-terminal hydrolase 8